MILPFQTNVRLILPSTPLHERTYMLTSERTGDDCLVEYMMQLPRSRSPELSPFGGLQGRVVKDVVAMIWAFGHMTLLSIRTR